MSDNEYRTSRTINIVKYSRTSAGPAQKEEGGELNTCLGLCTSRDLAVFGILQASNRNIDVCHLAAVNNLKMPFDDSSRGDNYWKESDNVYYESIVDEFAVNKQKKKTGKLMLNNGFILFTLAHMTFK